MRKFLCISVACTAFAFGILGYYERPNFMPVSLYDITQNAELYKWQKIRIKAYLETRKWNPKDSSDSETYSSIFNYKKNCAKDCIEGASLHLPKNVEANGEISNLVKELAEKNNQINPDDGSYFAEVEIVGEIEKINSCFGSPYVVKAESIKQTSPIRFMSNSEFMTIAGRK